MKDDIVSERIENKFVPVTLHIYGMRGLRKLYFSGRMEEAVEKSLVNSDNVTLNLSRTICAPL